MKIPVSAVVRLHQLVLSLPLVATLCILGSALVLCLVASPSADDFCRAALRLSDLPTQVFSDYKTWSPRWAELTVAITLFPRHSFPFWYPHILIGLLSAYFATMYVGLSGLFGVDASTVTRAGFAAGFLALFAAGTPSIGETAFWASGEVSSVLPVFGSVCLFGLLLSSRMNRNQSIWSVGLCGLTLFLTGMHEMYGVILSIALGMGVVATTITHHPNRWLWVNVFLAAAAGSALIVLAPGNQARAAVQFAGIPQVSWSEIIHDVGKSRFSSLFREWFLDVKLVAATLVFFWHPAVRRLCPAWLCRHTVLGRALVVSGWLLVMASSQVLPLLAVSRVFEFPGRTLAGLYAVFLICWFTTVFVFTRPRYDEARDYEITLRATIREAATARRSLTCRSEEARAPEVSLGHFTRLFACIVFAASILQSPNTLTMYNDLRFKALPWRAAVAQRIDILEARTQQHLDLSVPSLTPLKPRSFFYQDVGADPKHFTNICVAAYFGLNTVVSQTASQLRPSDGLGESVSVK